MNRLGSLALAGLLGATLGARGSQGQPAVPQTTFRAGVDIVDVDVSVLDKHRLPIRNLTAADFTVLEDGRPRPIVAFSTVQLPPRELPPARWMDRVAPDVASNAFLREGRLIVILMDRSITTIQRPVARQVAETVVDQLRPGDLAALVYATHGVPQNFTADRQRLLDAIRRPFAVLPEGDSGSAGECFCGLCSLETITRIAEATRDVRQRRKILYVIGSNMSVQSMGACGGALTNARSRALRALEVGNLTVHTFDPAGLQTLSPTASQPSPPSGVIGASLARRANLQLLPDHTGGRAVFGTNAPADAVAAVFRETNSYYVLGFQPGSSSPDGRFRDITVKVARPDVIIQARQGYYAPGARRAPAASALARAAPPSLVAAVTELWPKTAVGLTMSAVPFALPGLRDATIALVIGVNHDLERDGSGDGLGVDRAPPSGRTVEVLVGAFDRNGRSMGYQRQSVPVAPRPIGSRTLEYEILSLLPLAPGRYEIRAAVEDPALRATGSVYGYVDVPDFSAELVSLSGILLEAAPAGAAAPHAALAGLVPIVPTARRLFPRSARVTAFVRIHQGVKRALMPGYLEAEVVDDADNRVFHHESRLVPEHFGANRAMDFTLELPFTRLEPGQYLLTIEVRHGNASAKRDLRFTIDRAERSR